MSDPAWQPVELQGENAYRLFLFVCAQPNIFISVHFSIKFSSWNVHWLQKPI